MTLEDPLVFGRSPSRGTPSGSGMIDVDLIGAPAFAVRVVGGDFVYAGVNARLSEITGLASAELVGRTPRACFPRDVADGPAARYRTCVEFRQSCESELYLEGPAGARWWHVTLTPVFDADGTVAGLIGDSTDISDRRRAEQTQRDADARIALAMDVLDGGFCHLDAATGEVETSPKLALLMTGSAAERMTWTDFVARIHPHSTFADFGGIGWDSFRHGSVLSRVGASGKPGAVQWTPTRWSARSGPSP